MELPVSYIGLAQSVFVSLLLFLKAPLKIADIILGCWSVAISCMFGLNVLQDLEIIQEEKWSISLSISITFPPLLYLYSKYVTHRADQFQKKDYRHILLAVLLIIMLAVTGDSPGDFRDKSGVHYWVQSTIGAGFVIMLWWYGILALRNIITYKKRIVDLYSYKSDRVSLTWLFVVIASFILVYNVIIVASTLREVEVIGNTIDPVRNISLLAYVYILGIWGSRQNQLMPDAKWIPKYDHSSGSSGSKKYQKSGLGDALAEEYKHRLIRFMNETDAWKDHNLSISTLSRQTNIARHHITEVINEYLGKNFYVFVNEYRIEHAKKLIRSPEYRSMTFTAIAYECGFNSKTAFYRYFKNNTGVAPSQYRKTIP